MAAAVGGQARSRGGRDGAGGRRPGGAGAAGRGGRLVRLVAPVAGHLSDHCTSRRGMRRPWILGGALVGLLGLLLLALAHDTVTLAAGWVVTVAGYQSLVSALTTVVVDQYPPQRRTRVAGAFSMCNLAGVVPAMVLSSALPGRVTLQFALCGSLALAAAALLCLKLPDRRLAAGERPRAGLRSAAASLVVLPRGARDVRLLWTQRLETSAVSALMTWRPQAAVLGGDVRAGTGQRAAAASAPGQQPAGRPAVGGGGCSGGGPGRSDSPPVRWCAPSQNSLSRRTERTRPAAVGWSPPGSTPGPPTAAPSTRATGAAATRRRAFGSPCGRS
ncbi:MFS transporter [Kitasatospora sp. NPDC092039]|uniref:MFS transporter n=1 Tax=Kitasatospora sp. NPDC092039 TaxID=3364086 RepID=UPI0038159AC0